MAGCITISTPTVATDYSHPDYWDIEEGREQDFAKDRVQCMERMTEIKATWAYMGACLEAKGWKRL